MAVALPGLPAFWRSPDYADAEVIVVAAADAETDAEERVFARLPVHRLVVAAASPYFAALFARWPCAKGLSAPVADASPPPNGCRRVVELRVESDEDAAAAVALLRCCYSGVFDAALEAGEARLRAAGQDGGGGDDDPESAGRCGCWQQLAVRTLVLADRLGCAGVVNTCVATLAGRLFAHQMTLDAATAALCLLPETLACQAAVAPLLSMAAVRVERAYAVLEAALADAALVARLQLLPAAVVEGLLSSDELRIWAEGAALAALDAWAAGPAAAAAPPEHFATVARAVSLPLASGPALAAAALMLPLPLLRAWPLEALARYHAAGREERFELSRAALEARGATPWSATRRPRCAPDRAAAVLGVARLSRIRGLLEAGPGGALPLGGACFGGYAWQVALVCRLEAGAGLEEEEGMQEEEAEGRRWRQGAPSAPRWRLGLQISASPMIGCGWGAAAPPAAPEELCELRRLLLSVGASKTAAAARLHCGAEAGALAGALDVVAGVGARSGEHLPAPGQSNAAGPFEPLLLRETCGDLGGRAWCFRARASDGSGDVGGGGGEPRGCGLCRHGVATGGSGLPSAGVGVGVGGGAALIAPPPPFRGWQPSLWSALAPGGQLAFRCDLRVLTDY